MAKREMKFEKPACGYCGKLTRVGLGKQSRICERGHKLTVKRGARH